MGWPWSKLAYNCAVRPDFTLCPWTLFCPSHFKTAVWRSQISGESLLSVPKNPFQPQCSNRISATPPPALLQPGLIEPGSLDRGQRHYLQSTQLPEGSQARKTSLASIEGFRHTHTHTHTHTHARTNPYYWLALTTKHIHMLFFTYTPIKHIIALSTTLPTMAKRNIRMLIISNP